MRNNRRNKRNFNINTKIAENKVVRSLVLTVVFFTIILLFLFIVTKFKNHILLNNLSKKINDIISSAYNEPDTDKNETSFDKISKTSFTLTAIGDIMCHNTQYWDAYNKSNDEYDFSYVFDDVKSYTLSSDITIGNLETSFAGKERGYSNYPTFNSPDTLAKSIADIGVDVISTAGNHCLDMGFSGLSRTIDVLDNYNISHLGTYKTEESQKKFLYKDVNGVKISFIDYTYGTNGIPIPSGKNFCVNLINKNLIKSQIEKAKSEDADIIVACMHWGTEYKTSANDEQKELADFLFKSGIDIILGNHPHVIEPMEKKTITLDDGSTKDVFVVYALGNFTADQRAEITRDSAILNLDITKDSDGKILINRVSYVPIYMYKNSAAKVHKFKILDIEKSIANYDSGDSSIGYSVYSNLKVQLKKIGDILGDEIN